MKKRIVILIGLFVLVFALVGTATAKPIRTPVTGVGGYGTELDPGNSWIADGVLYWRDRVVENYIDASDDRLDCTGIATINLDWKIIAPPAMFTGPAWGDVHCENEGGSWHGFWKGIRDKNGYAHVLFVLYGEGGYEGKKAMIWGERLSPDSSQPLDLWGFIRE